MLGAGYYESEVQKSEEGMDEMDEMGGFVWKKFG